MRDAIGLFLLIGLYQGMWKSDYPKATFYIALSIFILIALK